MPEHFRPLSPAEWRAVAEADPMQLSLPLTLWMRSYRSFGRKASFRLDLCLPASHPQGRMKFRTDNYDNYAILVQVMQFMRPGVQSLTYMLGSMCGQTAVAGLVPINPPTMLSRASTVATTEEIDVTVPDYNMHVKASFVRLTDDDLSIPCRRVVGDGKPVEEVKRVEERNLDDLEREWYLRAR